MRISCRKTVIFRSLTILLPLLDSTWHPSNWAAIASIAPAAFLMQKDCKDYLIKIKNANLPVMIVQGDKDTIVPPVNTSAWVDAMKEMGMKYE
jgi:fermentation-respiration switch protein FrsA (DUF1100 family)